MATLPTLYPGAADVTGLPTTGSIISSPGGVTALSDASDATFDSQSTNTSGTYQYGRAMDNTPGDFGTMATLAITIRYGWASAVTNSTWDTLDARVVGSDGTTILAAASAGGTFQQIATPGTTATPTNSSATGFSYVNTTANKTAWDGAIVQIQWTRTRSKGGDTVGANVYQAFLSGTYNLGATTVNGSFTANANIKRNAIPGSFTANANVKRVGITQQFTADAFVSVTTANTFTADAAISTQTQGNFTADATILSTIAGNFSADAYVKKTTEGSFTADSHVTATLVGNFTADAYIQGLAPSNPTWVSPADTATVSATPVLVFEIPSGPAGNYHFHMEIDTANTFDTGNLRSLKTYIDQTGWEYDQTGSGGWVAVPSTGVASTYAGNQARYTVQSPLTTGVWYRRVRAGV